MIYASGIMLISPHGRALFLRRSGLGDHAGQWCFPGGKIEGDESAAKAAVRECLEETGYRVGAAGVELTTRIADDVHFTIFMAQCPDEFIPKLNGEHTAYAWVSPKDALSMADLHPGVMIALQRIGMDELDIARAMAAGELASPQHYYNLWLYCMRVTGTDRSFRPSLNEFVQRQPQNYLDPTRIDRYNGLPVIIGHPEGSVLDSKEYGERIVGAIMLPFVRGDEVWAICRIHDTLAVEMLQSEVLSTSPAVLLARSGTSKVMLENGKNLLLEGKATLLDHLAIVPKGVWDKGGEASGIEQTDLREDVLQMADSVEDKARKDAEEKSRKDAEEVEARRDAKFDMILKGIDGLRTDMASCNSRMDAWEDKDKKRADAATAAADAVAAADAAKKEKDEAEKARKDAEESATQLAADAKRKDEMAHADTAGLKTTIEDLQTQIKQLSEQIQQPFTDTARQALTGVQARADSIFTTIGQRAPQFLVGETPIAYRRRLAANLKQYSPRWKDVNLDLISDETAFTPIEGQVYADATEFAKKPNDISVGKIREVKRNSDSGHAITEFFGAEGTHFVKQFTRPARRARITNSTTGR